MPEEKIRTATLTLTENCNLSCIYCYEHNKSRRKMGFQTAKRIVDHEFDTFAGYDGIEFDLFGGEPFLEFDLLKEITEYICQRKGDIPCTVFTSTNGTLIHGEVQEWLKKHRGCFVCGLSLDGTREMHNLNRSGSYDDIDLEFFLEQYPDQDVKMTISQQTLSFLAEGIIDMHKKGFRVSCNLAYEIDWSGSENINILNRELSKLIDFYLEKPDIEPCSMLEMGIYNIGSCDSDAVRFCGSGNEMIAYDVTGEAYPCQFFMPLSIGKEKAERSKTLNFPKMYLPEDCLDEKCKSCVARPACPNCYGANFASTGSIYKRDDNMCRLTKIILRARSYFRARQWECGQLHGPEGDTQALLRAIVRIQEELKI